MFRKSETKVRIKALLSFWTVKMKLLTERLV